MSSTQTPRVGETRREPRIIEGFPRKHSWAVPLEERIRATAPYAPHLALIITSHSARSDTPYGTSAALADVAGFADDLFAYVAQSGLGLSISLPGVDVDQLRKYNPLLTASLAHSPHITILGMGYSHFEPFILPDVFAAQYAFGAAAFRAAGFTRAPVAMIPCGAGNMLASADGAIEALVNTGSDAVLLERFDKSRRMLSPKIPVKNDLVVVRDIDGNTLPGIVINSAASGVISDAVIDGSKPLRFGAEALRRIAQSRVEYNSPIAVVTVSIEELYMARASGSADRFKQFIDILNEFSSSGELSISGLNAETMRTIEAAFVNGRVPTVQLTNQDTAGATHRDRWASRLAAVDFDALSPVNKKAYLYAMDRSYRWAARRNDEFLKRATSPHHETTYASPQDRAFYQQERECDHIVDRLVRGLPFNNLRGSDVSKQNRERLAGLYRTFSE